MAESGQDQGKTENGQLESSATREATMPCAACSLDAEGREARCRACPCVEKAEDRASAERSHRVMASATATLQLGVEGAIPMDRAVADAFSELFGHLYGPDEATRILAEGARYAR